MSLLLKNCKTHSDAAHLFISFSFLVIDTGISKHNEHIIIVCNFQNQIWQLYVSHC